MNKKTDQDEMMIRYLLGELAEERQLEMERQFFNDDEFYQQLLAVEDELRYEYAEGGLTREQRERFEKRFLTSDAERQRAALAGAVLTKAYEASAASAPEVREKRGWLESLISLITAGTPGMRFAYASAAAALLVIVGGSWLILHTIQLQNQVAQLEAARRSVVSDSQRQLAGAHAQHDELAKRLEQEQSRLREMEQTLAKRPAEPAVFGFVLVPGLLRDSSGPKRLIIPPDADAVRLQLQTNAKEKYPRYRVSVQTLDGAAVFEQDTREAAAVVPARLLPAGDYMVTLHGITTRGESEEAGDFYFTVVGR
jgi:hypothetical protein